MQLACRLLSVAESGYYEWRSRPPSQRAIRHVWLTDQIRAVHTASRGTYGARRVHAELTLGLGLAVGHGQVEMLMARAAIKGLPGTRRPRPRHETPTAVDLVERMFTREAPNRLWVTDITEHRTYEGKVYCAVVLDTFSRRVVGWSIDSSQTAALVTNALGMAIANRDPSAGRLCIPTTACNSPRGPSLTGPSGPGWCHRWAPSVTATTTLSSNPSGAECKPNCSTGNAGRPGSSWPMRSSTIWRSSTTVSAVIRPWECVLR